MFHLPEANIIIISATIALLGGCSGLALSR